jgi:Ferroportin1 (FPN1)
MDRLYGIPDTDELAKCLQKIDAEHRGSFSSIEASLQNQFELLSYSTTVYFSKLHQFRWPVLCSWTAVYVAALLYASFVRARRAHLVTYQNAWSTMAENAEPRSTSTQAIQTHAVSSQSFYWETVKERNQDLIGEEVVNPVD